MNLLKKSLLTLGLMAALPAFADVSLTTGAEYVNMVKELTAAYEAAGHVKVTQNYGGNIGQMLSQIRSGNGVNVVVTDIGTLKNLKTPVEFGTISELGSTPLVFVWGKKTKVTSVADLATDKVTRFAYPDPKAAVYGRAAKAYLEGQGLTEKLKDKTLQIASVPQVMAYVVKGEVDAGFVNKTAAKTNAAKLGGSQEITAGYPPITMVAAVVKGEEKDAEVKNFLAFLKSDAARKILTKFGID